MFDIEFFKRTHYLKKQIMLGKKYSTDTKKEQLFGALENFRSYFPVIFNVETTNFCNFKCSFCPRTTLMTRKNERMSIEVFEQIVKQIRPWSQRDWSWWKLFVQEEYSIDENEMSQDHFYFYIIPKVLTLHGFGEPLLDKDIIAKVACCAKKDLPTYFSCNPLNLKLNKANELFDCGLNYIKFSIDSLSDKSVRGRKDKFSDNFKKIESLVDIKEKNNYNDLTIIVTMIKLDNKNNEAWANFEQKFQDMGLYVYLKDQDQIWLDGSKMNNVSIDWNQPCLSPWYSMSVKSNGDCVGCQEDYNNQIVFGNVKEKSLVDIWNSEAYKRFRKSHLMSSAVAACGRSCDKRTIGNFIK